MSGKRGLDRRREIWRTVWSRERWAERLERVLGYGDFTDDGERISLRYHDVMELVGRVEHTERWYAVRFQRLRDFLADEPIWPKVAAILANGREASREPPSYAQILNAERHRADRAEKKLRRMEDDLRAAATELPVELPEPGTVTAKLVMANGLLRRRVAELEQAPTKEFDARAGRIAREGLAKLRRARAERSDPVALSVAAKALEDIAAALEGKS